MFTIYSLFILVKINSLHLLFLLNKIHTNSNYLLNNKSLGDKDDIIYTKQYIFNMIHNYFVTTSLHILFTIKFQQVILIMSKICLSYLSFKLTCKIWHRNIIFLHSSCGDVWFLLVVPSRPIKHFEILNRQKEVV